jgi:hypothetical protein
LSEPEGLVTTAGEPFATGVSAYFDAHPEIHDPLPRIYVEVQPEGMDDSFLALLDTGGHYCIFHPDLAHRLRDRLTDPLTSAGLHTARGLIRGELYSHRVTLLAQRGDPLDIDATVFVSPDWRGPNLIGYVGVLDRFRFAIDPGGNRFYFGPLA